MKFFDENYSQKRLLVANV